MRTKVDLINHLVNRRGYGRYLEIGCDQDATFSRVGCLIKTGVDPVSGGTVRATSDEYFAATHDIRHDLILIDGDHRCEQVLRDVLNSLDRLTRNGTILVHDCLPATLEQTQPIGKKPGEAYTGDGWRVIASLARHPRLDVAVGRFDWGVGVIVPRRNPAPAEAVGSVPSIRSWTWEQYEQTPLFLTLGWEDLLEWIH